VAYYGYNATREAVQAIDGTGEPVRVVKGVGAYYAYDSTHEAVLPVNGLAGSMGKEAELADEAARTIIGERRPVLVVNEWAKQLSDTRWQNVASSAVHSLLPLTDRDIVMVKKSAFGHGLPAVGIIAARPVGLTSLEGAFVGSPYKFDQALAVSSSSDRRPVPTMLFLFIGTERDATDEDGGSRRLMTEVAATLGGKLVHIVDTGRAEHSVSPTVPVERAMAMQFPPGPQAPLSVPGAPPAPATPDVVPLRGVRTGFRSMGALGTISSGTGLGVAAGALALIGLGWLVKEKL
jgi:hypothetical protein